MACSFALLYVIILHYSDHTKFALFCFAKLKNRLLGDFSQAVYFLLIAKLALLYCAELIPRRTPKKVSTAVIVPTICSP